MTFSGAHAGVAPAPARISAAAWPGQHRKAPGVKSPYMLCRRTPWRPRAEDSAQNSAEGVQ